MEAGQLVELTIEDMSSEGQGIGKTDDGFVVFVPNSVVGDKVKATLTKVKKNYALSKLDEILEESPFRNKEFDCRICGGCPLGILQYEKQLEIKENQVRNKLERLAGVSFADDLADESAGKHPVFNSIIGMDKEDNDGDGPFRYRNKAVMVISHNKRGTLIGFNKARSHDVIDCSDCILQPMTVAAAVMATKEFMSRTKGWFTGMTVKTAFGTGQVMVVYDIVDKGAIERMMPQADLLIDLLDEAIYNLGSYDDGDPAFTLESVALRWEKKSDKGYHGPKRYDTMILAGSNTIVDEMTLPEGPMMQFEISPESFYQVNTAQMQRLYGVVRDYCSKAIADGKGEEGGKPLILDLYCGVGTIGLCVADLAEKVVGIEVVRDAVVDANRNAVINGIVNAFYVCGKAEEEIGHVLEEAGDLSGCGTIAILDPPRAGCRPELLEAIAKAGGTGAEHIVYVSCDPATLGRDIKILMDYGYKLEEATPVDMFPHTGHVETVVLMSRADR